MKKLLCIAVFSFAIMASTTAKKETVANNNSKEVVKIEKNDLKMSEIEISEKNEFFGCGSEGNGYYNIKREEGMSHREARSARRAYVRKCRGNGPDGWLSIFISWA